MDEEMIEQLLKDYEDLGKENERLREIEIAAAAVIQLAIVRKISKDWNDKYVAALNRLAVLVPGTRDFERDPLR